LKILRRAPQILRDGLQILARTDLQLRGALQILYCASQILQGGLRILVRADL
jgi:hypothetical protein